MLTFTTISSVDDLKSITRQEIIDFLHTHLDRFRDTKEAIGKCIDYTLSNEKGKGGFILTAHYQNQLAGILIISRTGMNDFIPENILVYIAVNSSFRGQGFGKEIITKALAIADGDVKLHVEYDNPAKRLYERLGFTSKYAEMRYLKGNN